jgi:hypothetical protein
MNRPGPAIAAVRSCCLARSNSRVAIPTDDLGGVGEPIPLSLEAVVNLLGAACRASIVFGLGPAARVEFRLSLGHSVTFYPKLTLPEPELSLHWLCLS